MEKTRYKTFCKYICEINLAKMLSSLDALAEKISPGSGKNSPSQTQSPQSDISSASKTHFSQNIHPYQKLDHINNNNNNRER